MTENVVEVTTETEVEEPKKEGKLKKIGKWLNKDVKIRDVLLAAVAPVCALIGVCYTADKRLEEKELDVEIKKMELEAEKSIAHEKAVSDVTVAQIRVAGKLAQLDKITKSSEEQLPDTLSLKTLNDNDKD